MSAHDPPVSAHDPPVSANIEFPKALPMAPCQAKPVAPHPFSSPPVDAPTRPCPTTWVARGQGGVALGDIVITEFGISVRHLDRLPGGLVLATSPRVEWAKLLRRTFAIDALRCPHCTGRLRLLAALTEKATVTKILEHLGLSAAPTVPRARSPDQDELSSWMGGAAITANRGRLFLPSADVFEPVRGFVRGIASGRTEMSLIGGPIRDDHPT